MEGLPFVNYCSNNYFKSYKSNLDVVVYTLIILEIDMSDKFVEFYNNCFKFGYPARTRLLNGVSVSDTDTRTTRINEVSN